MISIELLAAKINQKLRSIRQELSLAAKTGKPDPKKESILSEYLDLIETDGIISAIQYIIMDGLAQYFSLYEDDREHQQLIAAVAEELEIASESEILVSIQIIQYTYPSIYQISRKSIELTQKRALEHLTKIPVAEPLVTSTYAIQHIQPEVIVEVNKNSGFITLPNIISPIKTSIASSKKNGEYHTARNMLMKLMIAIKITIEFLIKVTGSIIHATIVGIILVFSIIFEAFMGAIDRN